MIFECFTPRYDDMFPLSDREDRFAYWLDVEGRIEAKEIADGFGYKRAQITGDNGLKFSKNTTSGIWSYNGHNVCNDEELSAYFPEEWEAFWNYFALDWTMNGDYGTIPFAHEDEWPVPEEWYDSFE